MRLPVAIAAEIERVARRIMSGEVTYGEGADAVEVLLCKKEHRLFVAGIHRRWARNQIKAWIAAQVATAAGDGESGQAQLPFPELRALLEIAPGTFVHQRAMAMADWNAAVAQAETKELNACGFADRVRRARDRAAQLLAPSPPRG